MAERKNIFLIGRRGHEDDEDQLTEMLAFLWQECPAARDRWLSSLGLVHEEPVEVETQFSLPSRKRPDLAIRSRDALTLVESKLRAGFHDSQVAEYLRFLGGETGRRSLVILTKRPEGLREKDRELASELGIGLVAVRWHDMAKTIGEDYDDTLEGDFVRLLVREGLVKPDPFTAADWVAWNAGYNVLLRVETLLNEVGAHVGRLIPGAVRKGVPGLSKQWLYFTWGTDTLDVGLGFAASPGGGPHGSPTVFSFVRNHGAELDSAIRAVGQTAATRNQWGEWPDTITWCGLHYSSPALSRSIGEVIEAEEFEAQVEQTLEFMRETIEYFRARGYLPAA